MLLANVAIPTFVPHWIVGFIVLLPVVGIEALIAQRRLALGFPRAFGICGLANIKSTLAGIPLAYFVSLFVTLPFALIAELGERLSRALYVVFFIGGMADPPPYNISLLTTLVLMVPYYYASVWIEGRSLQRSLPAVDQALIHSTAIAMNRTSYAMLFIAFVIFSFLHGDPNFTSVA